MTLSPDPALCNEVWSQGLKVIQTKGANERVKRKGWREGEGSGGGWGGEG